MKKILFVLILLILTGCNSYEASVLTGRPTTNSITMNIVSPTDLSSKIVYYSNTSEKFEKEVYLTGDFTEVKLTNLSPSTTYYYEIGALNTTGKFRTQREEGPFVFSITSDSHARIDHKVLEGIVKDESEFWVTLGDESMTHIPEDQRKWNERNPEESYLYWREQNNIATKETPLFYILGNHDGELPSKENKGYGVKLLEKSREQRLKYIVNPKKGTYDEGAGDYENYFAWTWGDVLFIAIDGYSYNEADEKIDNPDDWTIGEKQMKWLERTLKESNKKWKFILAPQIIGGSDLGGNYGRGGVKFAETGEQAKIHELMKEHNVQAFFFGHNHVFSRGIRDDIQYLGIGQSSKRDKEVGWINDEEFQDAYVEKIWGDKGRARITVEENVTIEFIDKENNLIHKLKLKEDLEQS